MITDWRAEGACSGSEPELFFPIGTNDAALAQTNKAKRICYHCPVQRECLEWAFDINPGDGIFGGLTWEERRRLRRTRTRHARSGRPVDANVVDRRRNVAKLTAQGVSPAVIASRLGTTADIVSADLVRIREAA